MRGRFVSLEGFYLCFADLQRVSRVTFARLDENRKHLNVFLLCAKTKFVYSVLKLLRTKILSQK